METSTIGGNRESEKMKIDGNKDVDPQLWHAVAGGMVRIPELNSKIFYFPQGHAEHAYEPVNFPADINIPSKILCRVAAVHYRADPDTDELYAKLRLVPLHPSDVNFDDDAVAGVDDNLMQSYSKTLTQSDAYRGGFACPKNCAEIIFPPLDYSDKLPSQDIYPVDVHGKMWKFRHIYSTRNILTTGWSDFVTNKQLDSGDSVVFVKAANSDLHIGIRRSKNGNGLKIRDRIMDREKVKAEDVIEAIQLGVNIQPFDVVYYPWVGTPVFFVKTSLIRTALQIGWGCGMRFKMAFETEDSSKINWLMGTIASVEAADPAWPDSLWRLLRVTWDEPVLTNMKMVNPWQVKITSDMPSKKKRKLSQRPTFPIDGQLSMPTFPNNFQTRETSTACMHGARHDHFSHLKNIPVYNPALQMESTIENNSCSIPISTQPSEKLDHLKPDQILLFGKPIQDLLKRSSGERLECKKDALAEETVESEDSGKN
ncbi:unnamed protein product [Vicia faba]|uniref:Auxin response factor n=1 Tax=Vicia faba TaxID=3906 RepID=A0AAV1AVT7_VICFA|nr:unnamed protein product [Vicia faba]